MIKNKIIVRLWIFDCDQRESRFYRNHSLQQNYLIDTNIHDAVRSLHTNALDKYHLSTFCGLHATTKIVFFWFSPFFSVLKGLHLKLEKKTSMIHRKNEKKIIKMLSMFIRSPVAQYGLFLRFCHYEETSSN